MWKRISERKGEPLGLIKSKPEFPAELDYLWHKYFTIMNGCDKLSLIAINAYEQVYREKFDRWEIDALLRISQKEQEHG